MLTTCGEVKDVSDIHNNMAPVIVLVIKYLNQMFLQGFKTAHAQSTISVNSVVDKAGRSATLAFTVNTQKCNYWSVATQFLILISIPAPTEIFRRVHVTILLYFSINYTWGSICYSQQTKLKLLNKCAAFSPLYKNLVHIDLVHVAIMVSKV